MESALLESKIGNSATVAWPWMPDLGDGSYQNPVIHADYSDPDVVRVGDDFYLTASSFNCTPGLPILHSKDLVNWTLINHAIKNLPDPRYKDVQAGCGVWAPAIRYHDGKFWIFFPMPDEGIYLTTAADPAGEWSEPHLVQAGKGLIDPCPLWDDDGQAYLVHAYARSRCGLKHMLRVRPMAPDGSRLLGEGQIVFHDEPRHPTLEGPKFLKKDGWYYILAPAGGVETGWQVALRSKNIYGPYEDKIILQQGRTNINGPHQGALVDSADDGWWFIHFQDADIYGRITHLQPIRWENGWPIAGANGEPVLRHKKLRGAAAKQCTPQTSDAFDSVRLGLQWQWNANHEDGWHSLTARPNWLRLYSQPAAASLQEQPNLLLQKFPARTFSAETLLHLVAQQPGDEAGLVIAGRASAAIALRRGVSGNELVFRRDNEEKTVRVGAGDTVRLRVVVRDGGRCEFSFAQGNDFVSLPDTFIATKGVWIGARLGIYAVVPGAGGCGGHADFKYFRFASGAPGGQ